MKIERPRHEAANERSFRRKRAVPCRRQVNRAHPRLKRQDWKRPRVNRSVPADHVERRVGVPEVVVRVLSLHADLSEALVDRSSKLRTAKVTVAVRCVHPELPNLVAPLFGNAEARAFDRKRLATLAVQNEAMDSALGNAHVVAGAEREVPERASNEAGSASNEENLVGVAIGRVDLVARRSF